MGFVGEKIMLLKYSYKRCSLFREDRYKDTFGEILIKDLYFFLSSPAQGGEGPAQALWAMTELDTKALCGHSHRCLVVKLYLVVQKTFPKGFQEGTEYFNFRAGNIPSDSMSSLLVTGRENRHLFPGRMWSCEQAHCFPTLNQSLQEPTERTLAHVNPQTWFVSLN